MWAGGRVRGWASKWGGAEDCVVDRWAATLFECLEVAVQSKLPDIKEDVHSLIKVGLTRGKARACV